MKLRHILLAIFISLLVCGGLAGGMFGYVYFTTPELAKTFDKYKGVDFDYHLDESAYKQKFYYQQLIEDEVIYYRCMYHAASLNSTKYLIDIPIDTDAEYRARCAFSCDFPEYYWFENVNFEVKCIENPIEFLNFYYYEVTSVCYGMNEEDIVKTNDLIEQKISLILPSLRGKDEAETCKNIYDYIINNVSYDMDYLEMSDIRACLLHNKAVCSSYSETFQFLCNKLGIECYSVTGLSLFNEVLEAGLDLSKVKIKDIEEISDLDLDKYRHEWCVVRIGGNWYWVDPTWGDAAFSNYYGEEFEDYIDYTRLLAPDDKFLLTHKVDDMFKYPECNDPSLFLKDGSGLFFNNMDIEIIKEKLVDAFFEGKTDLLFQFEKKEDMKSFNEWVSESENFFGLYKDEVYEYYDGHCKIITIDDYTLLLIWNIENLY